MLITFDGTQLNTYSPTTLTIRLSDIIAVQEDVITREFMKGSIPETKTESDYVVATRVGNYRVTPRIYAKISEYLADASASYINLEVDDGDQV